MAKRTTAERFWPKVNKHGPIPKHRPELGPCWIWTAGRSGNGTYGSFKLDGRTRQAHQVAFELLVGPIPDGLEPDHLCRVKLCVKAIADEHGPAHLDPVTHRTNTLRGDTIMAAKVAQTRCKHGHPFDEANTYYRQWRGQVHRGCRACNREAVRRYESRRGAR